MGLSSVTINVGEGGLGRRPLNKDKISGIIFYNDTPPTGWVTVNIQKVFTLAEAEAKGLTETAVGHESEWYHVREYFRIQPEGEIFIGYFAVPVGAFDYLEIESMQQFAAGEIRQIAVYARDETFAGAEVAKISAVIAGSNVNPDLSCLATWDFTALVDWSTAEDLRAVLGAKVTTVIGQDGGAKGLALSLSGTVTVSTLGAALGAVSRANVQQSIGEVGVFNVSDGSELEVLALANGDLLSAISAALLGNLKDKGYLVNRKYTPDVSGSFFERAPTATLATSDFAFIENDRTIDKAVRVTRTALTPQLQRTLLLNSDGTLQDETVEFFLNICSTPLEQMQSDGEISDFEVLIDPDQPVLSTSTLTVTIKILPLAIGEFIVVEIGFTAEI